MARILVACRTWLRNNLAWSASPLEWQERLGIGLLALAVLTMWGAEAIPLIFRPVVAVAFLVALAVLFRRGWLKLLGPVAVHELVRTTRRSHFVLYRLYTYFILIVMALFYCVWEMRSPNSSQGLSVPAKDMSQ